MAVTNQTWDDKRLRNDRIGGLQEQMKLHGIGAMYLTDVNLLYALCLKIPGSAAFVPADGEAVALVRPRDKGWVSKEGLATAPTQYDGSSGWEPGGAEKFGRFGHFIADMMRERGVGDLPLGLDELEAAAFLGLQEAGVRIVDATGAIEKARSVKTADEVAIYRLIAEQYEATFKAFKVAVRPGITEKQLADVAVSAWQEAGGEDVSQINVCAGEHMNPWSRWPTDRELQDGEFVGIDFHARGPHGLRGNVSRTYVVGDHPTSAQREHYRHAYDYLQGVMGAVRGGRPLKDVLKDAPTAPQQYEAQLGYRTLLHSLGMMPSGYPH
ncbi:MAG: peptidase, partial [Chloroflexi bacterium]|nr:peptidase [Chloroflexota bacterium]